LEEEEVLITGAEVLGPLPTVAGRPEKVGAAGAAGY